ncbi:magnesium/cobalt transporter CorA [Streptomyces sp. A7024]|uniref:Magnesium transport protein CorA n=1 Tax=Streptomyces coryli TaxID=1128680 RepID=A0A6G4U0H2_9ACTN|nr:magnesium/cobalt transporter CorA [Streptomyces coryli]NGN64878.1 magnesium/cobalt transporter CorA [Streptomyces coryli]
MSSVIVDCALYREGRRTGGGKADFATAYAAALTDPDAFVWLGLYEPTGEEFDTVTRQVRLHPLAVEDALSAHQRPKLEVYDDTLYLVLKPVLYHERTDTVEVCEISVFIGDSFVITVRHGTANPLGTVRARLEQDPHVLVHGPTAVMYAVSDAVVDNYLDVADDLHNDLEHVEEQVFEPGGGTGNNGRNHSQNTAALIYNFKRQALEFRRVTAGLAEPMQRLAGAGVPHVPEGARPFFRDVGDHLTRVTDHVESIDRLVTDVLQAHLAQTGVRQNDDMRRISAYAAMAAAPTVIGSVYGMNFVHMPELKWVWGYPAVLTLMVVVVGLLYRFFKKRGWL